MGLFGGSGRASRLAENAEGSTVTKKRLTKTGGRISKQLQDKPIIEYLRSGDSEGSEEQPHYIVFNESKGLSIFDSESGQTGQYPVQGNYLSVGVITDQRILLIIPLNKGDRAWEFSFESIESATVIDTGSMFSRFGGGNHRIDFRKGNHLFSFPVNSTYLNQDSAEEIEAYLRSTAGIPQLPPDDELAQRARREAHNTETYEDSPLSVSGLGFGSYLQSDETCKFIFRNRTRGLHFTEDDDAKADSRHYTPSGGKSAYVLITDQRVLFLIGRGESYREQTVSHDSVSWVDINTGTINHEMKLRATSGIYDFPIERGASQDELWDAEDYLRDDIGLASELQASKQPEVTSETRVESTRSQSISPTGSVNVPDGVSDASIPADELATIMRGMDSYSFETLVADLWQLQGWSTEVTDESGDMGIDVVAQKSDPVPQKQLIQAKRYREGNTIGSSKIQQYASLRHQEPGVDSVAVVTTSSFTAQASDVAESLNVKLIDIDLLSEIVAGLSAYDVVRWHAGSRLSEFEFEEGIGSNEEVPKDETEAAEPGQQQEPESAEADGGNTAPEVDPIDEIRRVRELHEEGILSEEEFEAKKQELLKRI